MKTTWVLITMMAAFCGTSAATEYHVATTGSDTNTGTSGSPWVTVKKAASTAVAGDTVWVHGGYYPAQPKATCSNVGTQAAPIRIWAVPGEEAVVLDFTGGNSSGFSITGSWYHIKGLKIQHAYNGGMRLTTAACQNNLIENCTAYDNSNMGFSIGGSSSGFGSGPSNNTFLNCDAYENNDPQNDYENADGFGFKYYIGTGNKAIGCRAWLNSDDGYDCWYSGNGVYFENCYAWHNGDNIWGASPFSGDGNGFKLGQMLGKHVVVRCAAWDHWHYGFDLNGNSEGVTVEQCTAVRCNQTFAFTFVNGTGYNSIIRNNVSYSGTVAIDSRMVNVNNSWNTVGVSIGADDFVSLDTAALEGPRQADGSIPLTWGLRLARTSEAVDAGLNIGRPYAGVAPDLGAFETGDTNNDWLVDWLDVQRLAEDWLAAGVLTDMDQSGNVNFLDYAIMMQYWAAM
jgi:parallel beta-helix repeat protein